MKSLTPYVVLALSVAAGAIAGRSASRSNAEVPAATSAADEAALAARLSSLETANLALEKKLDQVARSLEMRAGSEAREGVAAIDDAVARWFDAHPSATKSGADAAVGASKDRAPSTSDIDAVVARLADPTLSREEKEKLWKELREHGGLDAVVAAFEARAKANPQDPTAQLDLGKAYLQKIFAAGSNGPEAGKWALLADHSFDAALELDPHQWEARYTKGVSLSFWPPIFGKQAEAISQFEILIDQQKQMPAAPQFAQTHLWLGNLYQQSGNLEKAKAAWEAGLALYPDDQALKDKLAALGNH